MEAAQAGILGAKWREGGRPWLPSNFSFSLIVAMSTTGDRILDTALSKVCSPADVFVFLAPDSQGCPVGLCDNRALGVLGRVALQDWKGTYAVSLPQ